MGKQDENIKKERKKDWNPVWIKTSCIYVLAFTVPFTILCVAFASAQIYPFGSKQVLRIDAWHQYYPFLLELRRKLREGESLLYCWRIGLGSGFAGLAAYYLASPLNLLFVVFPEAFLREAFALLILVKIGFAGTFCTYSLNRINQKNEYGLVIFSTFYALCGWVLGYYWNIMWLDTFAVFPLIALGIFLLVREKKYKLYTISLAAAIWMNYYIGLMVCIFTIFYFFAQCINCKCSSKELIYNLKNIILFSVISIMMSAVSTLPAMVVLKNAYQQNSRPESWRVVRSWVEILNSFLAYAEPVSLKGHANVYCGLVCVLFFLVFISLSGIRKREKVVYTVLVLFFYTSMNINVFDYAWHGFRIPNQVPYRYTFMFSYVLVMLAYRAYCNMDKLKLADLRPVCVAGAFYFLIIFLSQMTADTSDIENQQKFFLKNFFLAAAYLGILLLLASRKIKWKVFSVLLAVVCVCELIPTVMTDPETFGATDRESYPDKYEQIQEILGDIAEDDAGFYRTELDRRYTANPAVIYDYRGIGVFSSASNANVGDAVKSMGLSARTNKYYYHNSTPVNNTFLNLKYLVSRNSEVVNKEYLTETDRVEDVYAYKNEAYLPVGFKVENAMAEFQFDADEDNPFENQNDLVKAAAGITGDVFESLDVAYVSHENVNVIKQDYGSYSYEPSKDHEAEYEKFVYNYQMPRDGCAYVFIDLGVNETKNINIESDSRIRSYEIEEGGTIAPAGTYQAGDVFSVSAELEGDQSGKLRIYVGILNQDVFEEAFQILEDESLRVSEYTSKSIKGTISVGEDGLMYTSIPYETGWNVYVDGKKADITKIAGAFIGTALSKGEHAVELQYSPWYVYLAAVISLVGIGIFIAVCRMPEKKRKETRPKVEKRKRRRKGIYGAGILMVFVVSMASQADAAQSAADIKSGAEADRPVPDGMYKVVSAADAQYVWDIDNASVQDGGNLQLWTDNGTNAQKFVFTYDGDGYYVITNVNSGKAVDCENAGSSDGANIQQYSANDTDAQRWKLTLTESGDYIVTCKCNGKAADVENDIAHSGANIRMYQLDGTAFQEFRLEETSAAAADSGIAEEHSRRFYHMAAYLIIAAETAAVTGLGYIAESVWKRKILNDKDKASERNLS